MNHFSKIRQQQVQRVRTWQELERSARMFQTRAIKAFELAMIETDCFVQHRLEEDASNWAADASRKYREAQAAK